MSRRNVAVVGAGMAGVACARTLVAAGHDVVVHDRGHRIGGRMARRTRNGRAIDIGASYFTARGPRFAAVAAEWQARGLARPWTDTFDIVDPDGVVGTTTGPVRWSTPDGLRSLVEDLARGLDVRHPVDIEAVGPGAVVDGEPVDAVVLAMPDPQARDLLPADLTEARAALDRDYEPALALAGEWDEPAWPALDGAFIHDSPVLTWVADDGRRRGDGAPVLVAHSTPLLAAAHLDDPAGAAVPMLDELRALLGIAVPPRRWEVKRWSLAAPAGERDAAYLLLGDGLGDYLGACGDGWGGRPRIEAAYDSGVALGEELARRLD